MFNDDEWKKSPSKKKKTVRMEYRIRPEHWGKSWLFKRGQEWSLYWKKYASIEERDMAMNVLNRKDTLYEYRRLQ